jgi:uncharacterized protein (DUF1330 family)
MSIYMIIESTDVLDASTYDEYLDKVPATVEAHGGRYLVRSENVTPLAGDWRPHRLIVIEFPSMQDMTSWARSPEYQALSPLRERSVKQRAVAVEGVHA